ncbi:hypothetical protein TNCV_431642 [Trichonephila clavipes]|nr:hypothetical protein TNCV_431642 [Trichonephila clavipes]
MWSMVAQRLTQITPPAAKPDQLWQRVEAAWSAVPQEHIQSLFESMRGWPPVYYRKVRGMLIQPASSQPRLVRGTVILLEGYFTVRITELHKRMKLIT